MVDSEEHDQVTPLLDAAPITRYHRGYVYPSEKDALYLRDMAWKAESVSKMFCTGMFEGKDAVQDVWRQRESM